MFIIKKIITIRFIFSYSVAPMKYFISTLRVKYRIIWLVNFKFSISRIFKLTQQQIVDGHRRSGLDPLLAINFRRLVRRSS